MDIWDGFTDEDLSKIKEKSALKNLFMKNNILINSYESMAMDKVLKDDYENNYSLSENKCVKLKQPLKKKDIDISTGTGTQLNLEISNGKNNFGNVILNKDNVSIINTLVNNHDKDGNMINDDYYIMSNEIDNLEKIRQKQKLVEELNKKKVEFILKTINEREKISKAETLKLIEIKKEFDQLDHLVMEDVSLIRDRIEEASRDYFLAQQRYDIAEKEFIESKINLQKKIDMKTNLTEHLYVIINQNEQRKASKLKELLQKLNLNEERSNPISTEPKIQMCLNP